MPFSRQIMDNKNVTNTIEKYSSHNLKIVSEEQEKQLIEYDYALDRENFLNATLFMKEIILNGEIEEKHASNNLIRLNNWAHKLSTESIDYIQSKIIEYVFNDDGKIYLYMRRGYYFDNLESLNEMQALCTSTLSEINTFMTNNQENNYDSKIIELSTNLTQYLCKNKNCIDWLHINNKHGRESLYVYKKDDFINKANENQHPVKLNYTSDIHDDRFFIKIFKNSFFEIYNETEIPLNKTLDINTTKRNKETLDFFNTGVSEVNKYFNDYNNFAEFANKTKEETIGTLVKKFMDDMIGSKLISNSFDMVLDDAKMALTGYLIQNLFYVLRYDDNFVLTYDLTPKYPIQKNLQSGKKNHCIKQ